jgi:Skp family chaperone for outer membrane proteins
VALFGKQKNEPVSIESEHQRLLAIRIAAEQELGRLRTELTERVAAVEARERELSDAIGRVRRDSGRGMPSDDKALEHAQVGLAAHAHELNRREREIESRERALLRMETDLARRAAAAAETPEERLLHIEERLKALQDAEKAFARTQGELAARSAELTSREAALAEHALSGVVDLGPVVPNRAEMDELDERLRRLERETREATKDTGFGESLRALEHRGLRGGSPAD